MDLSRKYSEAHKNPACGLWALALLPSCGLNYHLLFGTDLKKDWPVKDFVGFEFAKTGKVISCPFDCGRRAG